MASTQDVVRSSAQKEDLTQLKAMVATHRAEVEQFKKDVLALEPSEKKACALAVAGIAQNSKAVCTKFLVNVCATGKELLLPLYYCRLLPDVPIQGSGECKDIFIMPQPDGLNVFILTIGNHLLAVKEKKDGFKQLWKTLIPGAALTTEGADVTKLCPQLKHVLVGAGKQVHTVNLCSGTICPNPQELPGGITRLQLLGEMAVAGDFMGNVKTWNYQTGEEKARKWLPGMIMQLQLLGEMAVAGDSGGNVKTWNYQTGEENPVNSWNDWTGVEKGMVYKGLHISRSGSIAKAMLGATEVAALDEGLKLETFQISKIGVAGMKTRNGILCWDLELLCSFGVMTYGFIGKEYYEAKHWVNLTAPPAWIIYLMSALAMLATSGQMLGFSHTLPHPPTTDRIIGKLMFFQNIGLPDFSDIFMWIFWFDAFLCAVYVLSCLVFIRLLEEKYWAQPESLFFKIRELLLLYTQVVSGVGIVPMFKMLMRAIPCDAKGHMNEDYSVPCHSLEHVMCMATAISLGVLAAVVTYHMASVGFSAKAMNIQWNIFDTSRHNLPPERRYRHPLSLKDYAYDRAVALVKIALCTANISAEKSTTHAFINLVGMAFLLFLGMRYDKYFPKQMEKGRFLEPNYIITAIDSGTTWYFMLILISSIFTDASQDLFDSYKPLLNALARFTPLVALMGYIARSRRQTCSSYLTVIRACFDHHAPRSEHAVPLLQNPDH